MNNLCKKKISDFRKFEFLYIVYNLSQSAITVFTAFGIEKKISFYQ